MPQRSNTGAALRPQLTRRVAARGLASRLRALAAPVVVAGALYASGLGLREAQAQSAVQRAVVLDFGVGPTLDPILGRKAADGLAVELQRSNDYEIVTRQELEQAVASQPGLRPPYNEPTQARLAGVVGARSVFSGRVLRTIVQNGRSARVLIEVRQLDAATGDYINGTQINEVTDEKLQQFDNDVLVDEAINKAAFAAVRSMKQTSLPIGTVQNVANADIQLNIGTRNGVAIGQRYTVLRDQLNRARNIVERVKVGEITVFETEDNGSTARLSAGGAAGVRTGDKVRQIYVPARISLAANSASTSPVTSAPVASRSSQGGGGFLGGLGGGILGIGALALLVAFAGFGGGSTNAPTNAPRNVVAIPIQTSLSATDPITGVTSGGSAIQVNYSGGLPGLTSGQEVAGYLIFRSTDANFAISNASLIDFVRGNQTTYVDTSAPLSSRTVSISEVNPGTGNPGNNTGSGRLVINETTGTAAVSTIAQTTNSVTITAARSPLVAGTQYFYRVVRIQAVRQAVNTTNGNNTTTTINLTPVLSNASGVSGGATAIPTVTLDPAIVSTNLADFVVRVPIALPGGNIDEAVLEVSTNSSFPQTATFRQVFQAPRVSGGQIVLDADSIRVPNFDQSSGAPLFVRVGLRSTSDTPGNTVFTRTLVLNGVTGGTNTLLGGRFLSATGAGRRRGGLGLPGSSSGSIGRQSTRRGGGFILRPR